MLLEWPGAGWWERSKHPTHVLGAGTQPQLSQLILDGDQHEGPWLLQGMYSLRCHPVRVHISPQLEGMGSPSSSLPCPHCLQGPWSVQGRPAAHAGLAEASGECSSVATPATPQAFPSWSCLCLAPGDACLECACTPV